MYLEKKAYTAEEFRKALKISEPTWKKKRNYILDCLKQIMDFNIFKDGTFVKYEVINQFEDWKGIPRKKDVKAMREYYAEKTAEIVKRQPRNTGSNIARITLAKENKFCHKQDTAERYIRQEINRSYDKKDYEWCVLDKSTNYYYIMTDEQREFLFSLFSNYGSEFNKDFFKHASMLRNGLITKEEYDELTAEIVENNYKTILDEFRFEYGSVPVNVPLMELKPVSSLEEENC